MGIPWVLPWDDMRGQTAKQALDFREVWEEHHRHHRSGMNWKKTHGLQYGDMGNNNNGDWPIDIDNNHVHSSMAPAASRMTQHNYVLWTFGSRERAQRDAVRFNCA